MRKTTLLATGIVLGFALYGCGGKDPAADGGQAVSLQDMAADVNNQGDVLQGGAQGAELPESAQGEVQPGGVAGETWTGETGTAAGMAAGTEESAQPAATPAAGDIHGRNLEEIKDYLAQYPDTLQELSEAECYVVLHGKEYNGREYLDAFMGNVRMEVPDELVIVQFTVEGDPILVYLNYDGENAYCVEDASRDAWAGNGEKYLEKDYDSVWLTGEADTEGNFYLSLYALQEQDMIVEVFTAATEDPLACGLPLEENSAINRTMQSQLGTETESKLPLIEDPVNPDNGEGNCIELHDLPEWAKPPAP